MLSSQYRSSHTSYPVKDFIRNGNKPLWFIALLAVAIPLVPANINSVPWHGMKSLVFGIGSAILLCLSLGFRHHSGRHFGQTPRSFLLIPFILLALWASFSFLQSAVPGFSLCGWWLLVSGLIITSVLAVRAQQDDEMIFIFNALAVSSIIISFYTFAVYQSAGSNVAKGPYHDHEILGAALMILLPITLSLTAAPLSPMHRMFGSVALLSCATALLLSQNRSSWLGEAVALIVFGLLIILIKKRIGYNSVPMEDHSPRSSKWIQGIVTALFVLIALVYLLLFSPQSALLQKRLSTLTTSVPAGQDVSTDWRLKIWAGGLRMVREKPVLGWGIGTYPLFHEPFTRTGEVPAVVAADGPRIGDQAHNSYLQVAVDLGLPGLALWLAALVAAFYGGIKAFLQPGQSLVRRHMIAGCLAALAGQCVDAFANPGWQYGEATLYLWIVLGLLAAVSSVPRSAAASRTYLFWDKGAVIFSRLYPAISIVWVSGCGWVVFELLSHAKYLPVPKFP